MLKRWVEKIETKEKMKHWTIEPSRERPYFFPFLQYVTKTRLHLTLPAEMLQSNSKINHARLKQRVNDKGGCMVASSKFVVMNLIIRCRESDDLMLPYRDTQALQVNDSDDSHFEWLISH